MEPLQASALDPSSAIADASGVVIEGRAHAEHQRGVEAVKIAGHELLLARSADADPDDVRLQSADSGRDLLFFKLGEIAKWRREGSNDLRRRKTLEQLVAQFVGHTFLSSIEEVSGSGELLSREDLSHEIGTGDTAHGGMALQAANPHQRHAVGDGHRGGGVYFAQPRVALRLHYTVHAGDADITLAAAGERGFEQIRDVRDGAVHVDGIDINA